MDRSQILAQAIQAMSQGAAAPQPTALGPNLQQMGDVARQRDAWEAANPGQSYMGHGFRQLAQNIGAVPHTLMDAGRNLASIPGQAAGGFRNLVQGLPGFGGAQTVQPPAYGAVPRGADGLPLLGR